ncbi:MAG: L,D-transpeptidase family protein [Hyphomicrobium sp.]|nr:L,D-transpeptidase family protein [Hyphomicrobium sp.]
MTRLRFAAAAFFVSTLLVPAASADDAATPVTSPVTTGAITGAINKDTPAPSAVLIELRSKLASLPAGLADKERADQEALAAFYAAREGVGLWMTGTGFTPKARALISEIKNANAYGLDAKDFRLPSGSEDDAATLTTDATADAELQLSIAALKYARFARGGRISDPAAQLNTNLDRRPQWIEPKTVLDQLASSDAPDAVLRGLHPKHPQFEKLRQLYVNALPKKDAPMSASAKRLRANMEMWRWMNEDMGALHVLNNIPEFMQHVYKDGQIIRSEKIVAGMLDKQSSIFSRPLKYVVLRPAWRVPESIKVKELWPSLIRGGGYMRQYGLEMQGKDGRPVDWRKIDWVKSDIRNYEVIQPPGPRSVLGHVKFSFPSQHTIFMHDTPDKWMFRSSQRTLSHGCLRVWKPMELAEIILQDDKGWDKDKIAGLNRSGPLNNEVAIEKRIPIHLTYFTAWVGDDGRMKIFADIYGHEKRVSQALDGQWDKINKGRDHLAPVQPINTSAVAARAPAAVNRALPRSAQKSATLGDILGSALGLND